VASQRPSAEVRRPAGAARAPEARTGRFLLAFTAVNVLLLALLSAFVLLTS